VAALSGLLVLFTVRVARRPSTSTIGAVLSVAAALVLLRTVFHLAWYAAVATWVVFMVPAAKRARALALAALVFLAPAGWYAKNQLLFGFAGASSWLGMSMARMTVASLPAEDAERLRREGRPRRMMCSRGGADHCQLPNTAKTLSTPAKRRRFFSNAHNCAGGAEKMSAEASTLRR
jgi:hypothetical protein